MTVNSQHYNSVLPLLVALLIASGCNHIACPICHEISAEQDRVDTGIVLTNYDTSSGLLTALKSSRNPLLDKSASELIASYTPPEQTILMAISVYCPLKYVQACNNSISFPTDPFKHGTALLSGLFVGNGNNQAYGIYDSTHDRIFITGTKFQVHFTVSQYTNNLSRWIHSLQCQQHAAIK